MCCRRAVLGVWLSSANGAGELQEFFLRRTFVISPGLSPVVKPFFTGTFVPVYKLDAQASGPFNSWIEEPTRLRVELVWGYVFRAW